MYAALLVLGCGPAEISVEQPGMPPDRLWLVLTKQSHWRRHQNGRGEGSVVLGGHLIASMHCEGKVAQCDRFLNKQSAC